MCARPVHPPIALALAVPAGGSPNGPSPRHAVLTAGRSGQEGSIRGGNLSTKNHLTRVLASCALWLSSFSGRCPTKRPLRGFGVQPASHPWALGGGAHPRGEGGGSGTRQVLCLARHPCFCHRSLHLEADLWIEKQKTKNHPTRVLGVVCEESDPSSKQILTCLRTCE